MNSAPLRIVSAIIFAISFIIILGGCSDDKGSNPTLTDPGVLMPLAVGNTWTYLKVSIDLVQHDIVLNDVYFKITGDTTHGEETWFTTSGEEYLNKPDGLHKNIYHFIGTIGPVIYKYPTAAKVTYTNPDPSGGIMQTEVVTVSSEVEVTAGTFNCIVYNNVDAYDEGFWSEHLCYTPNIGLVLKESYYVRNPADTIYYVREELTGYTLVEE